MNINISNYGGWFLDYYEGTLPAEKVAELFLFLEQHPELRDEFDSFSLTVIPAEAVFYPGKEELKKSSDVVDIDLLLNAELEGDLTLQERVKLNQFIISNPQYIKDRELYRLCRLEPVQVIYPDKKSLKIKIINPYVQRIRTFAAAAILIFMLGILYINREEGVRNLQTAQTEQPAPAPKDNHVSQPEVAAQTSEEKNEKSMAVQSETLAQRNHGAAAINNTSSSTDLQVAERTDVIPAERKELQLLLNDQSEAEPIASLTQQKAYPDNTALAGTQEKHARGINEKIDDLKDKAADKINTVTGEELLYSQKEIADDQSGKIPLKSRLLKFVAWTVSKVSGDKVIMEPTFDDKGNLAAYQVSAGKFRYERDF